MSATALLDPVGIRSLIDILESTVAMDRDSILGPQVVEGMIAEGHTIVIFEDLILRLDCWLDKHPGGRLAIMHMVGRDATDEMKVYV